MYIFTFFLELAFLFNPFIPYPVDRFANLSFIVLAQIPLLGYSLYVIFLRKGYTLGLGSAVMILCLLWTLGFFTCFSSPYSGGISEGISTNEAEGMHWLSTVRDTSHYVISAGEGNELVMLEGHNDNHNFSSNYSEKYEPFYSVVTTYSMALSQSGQKHSEESASYENIPKDYKVQKIYDSLNIEIYEH
jgi:hypothetical protein